MVLVNKFPFLPQAFGPDSPSTLSKMKATSVVMGSPLQSWHPPLAEYAVCTVLLVPDPLFLDLLACLCSTFYAFCVPVCWMIILWKEVRGIKARMKKYAANET